MAKMMTRFLCAAALIAISTASAFAQNPPATTYNDPPPADPSVCKGVVPDGGIPTFLRPETPAQRLQRIGTEDPGCDPDPEKIFFRFGRQMKILKYDRQWANYQDAPDANYIRPFGFVNSHRELYQHNQKWVWAWEPIVEAAPAAAEPEDLQKSTDSQRRYSDRDIAYLQKIRSEFTELIPRLSGKTLMFEDSSAGLPTAGSFRNSLAVADMNGDGHVDLIVPPERGGGSGSPMIFLGDGRGGWKQWMEVVWPHPLDYGSVAATDFNKDGKMDLVFAVHLQGLFAMLGNGKGQFEDASQDLPKDFPTRRVVTSDVDRDGYPDIVSITEGPTAMRNTTGIAGKIRVYYNRNKGRKWEPAEVAQPANRVSGDYLAVGNFNGDRYPDFAGSNIYYGSPDIVYLSKNAKSWDLLDSREGSVVPFLGYYFANAAGRFTSGKYDDLLLGYTRFWPRDVNQKLIANPPLVEVTGIDMVSFTPSGTTRKPVARWGTKFGVNGMAAGDIDGDGNLDVIYTSAQLNGRDVVALLGDGKGNFTRARIEGIDPKPRVTYDLKLADVNGDKRADVILMYESDGNTSLSRRDGSIEVFLNRGVQQTAAK